jgi:hypothetical protein
MIMLQRKLIIKLREWTIENGKAPAGMKPNTFYPVVGYSVQKRKRKDSDETHEEMTGYYFVNEKCDLFFIYCSYVDTFVDPDSESIMSTETMRGGGAGGEKTEK